MIIEKYQGVDPVLVLVLNIRVSAGETQPKGITVLLEEMEATTNVNVVCAFNVPPLIAETVIE